MVITIVINEKLMDKVFLITRKVNDFSNLSDYDIFPNDILNCFDN